MLKELYIRNYALFSEIRIELGTDFNVFTGETGAGKSLLVGAVGLLLGNKADNSAIRKNCNEAEISGLLAINSKNHEIITWLKNYDIPLEETESGEFIEIVVRRILRENGKGSCYIQHVPFVRSKLGEFMALIFDLHSQHQNQSLFDSRQQLRMLDYYAQLSQRAENFSKKFQELNQKKKELANNEQQFSQQQEQIAYLREAIIEIEELKPQENEDTELNEKIALLSNVEQVRSNFEELLEVGAQALGMLGCAQAQLGVLAEQLRSVRELLPRLESASIDIEDILDSCKAERNNIPIHNGQLEELDQRLSKLIFLNRKYGCISLNETIRFGEETKRKLAIWETSENEFAEQKRQIQIQEELLMKEAHYLSQQRKKYVGVLEQNIEANLHNLGMNQAKFQIELSCRNNEQGKLLCHNYGVDRVRFLLAANPGEDFRELRQVASGGEISRIMLAIKSKPAQGGLIQDSQDEIGTDYSSSIETIIFDEIDAGIGGETGNKLAQYIEQLGQRKQIFCVTHLASIAASANTHIKIEKIAYEDSTEVRVYRLSAEARSAELARMLSGDSENAASLAHAKELLSRYNSGL